MATIAPTDEAFTVGFDENPLLLATLGGMHVFRALERLRDVGMEAARHDKQHPIVSKQRDHHNKVSPWSALSLCPALLDADDGQVAFVRSSIDMDIFSLPHPAHSSCQASDNNDSDLLTENTSRDTRAFAASSSFLALAAQRNVCDRRRVAARHAPPSLPQTLEPPADHHPQHDDAEQRRRGRRTPPQALLFRPAALVCGPAGHCSTASADSSQPAPRQPQCKARDEQDAALQTSHECKGPQPAQLPWLEAATVGAGAVCRTLAQVAIHPLDTLKTRMQVAVPAPQLRLLRAAAAAPGLRPRLLAAWASPAGARDLALGVGGAVGGTLPATAVFLATEGAVRRWVSEAFGLDRESAPCRLLASAAGAALSAIIRVPADVLKHRVQAYAYPCVPSAARAILAARGPAGLYAGFGATLLRDAPELVLQFGLYSQLKAASRARAGREKACGERDGGAASWLESVALGGAAGGAAAVATTPLDVIKTQLQCGGGCAAGGGGGLAGALRAVLRGGGGPGALFAGLGPRVAQTALCSAIFFTAFEAAKARLAAHASDVAAAQPAAGEGRERGGVSLWGSRLALLWWELPAQLQQQHQQMLLQRGGWDEPTGWEGALALPAHA